MSRKEWTKKEIVLWGLGMCGGAKGFVDTETVGVFLFEQHPGIFGLRTRPQYPDIDVARVQLSDAKRDKGEPGRPEGAWYLAVYGLLQALYTQQDAVSDLCKALSMESVTISADWHEYPEVRNVRNIRNQAIGHPTESGRKRPYSYHFISRVTLTQNGFDLHSMWDDGREEWRSVSLQTVIADQEQHLSRILEAVIEALRAEATVHKERFRMDEMVRVFPPSLPYAFQNLFQATRPEPNPARIVMAKVAVEEIRRVLSKFTEAATERGRAEALHLDWEYEQHAFDALDGFLDDIQAGRQPRVDDKTAYVFAFFLEKQIDYLRQTAKDIDEDYAQ